MNDIRFKNPYASKITSNNDLVIDWDEVCLLSEDCFWPKPVDDIKIDEKFSFKLLFKTIINKLKNKI